MKKQELQDKLDQAAQVIGKTWPLYSFVTSNPLTGYEEKPFFEALEEAGNLWDAGVLPKASVFRQAWEENKIDPGEIKNLLREAGKKEPPEYYLSELEAHRPVKKPNESHELDRLCVKWLSLFMDEGMAAWPMPYKEEGFYAAWRKLIVYDGDIKKKLDQSIPKTPVEALSQVLDKFEENDHVRILEQHLVALPGWAGFIKYRIENSSAWNREYPINLLDFLAVRLWMAQYLETDIFPGAPGQKDTRLLELKYIWLQAWENTWQNNLFKKLEESSVQSQNQEEIKPNAQLVFCLDTRSEIIRRHLEGQGNYETFGSAGAFGIPMDYRDPETGMTNKSSPAMAPSHYIVNEETPQDKTQRAQEYQEKGKRIGFYNYFLKRMKNILPSAFGFVEGSGFYYAFFILLRIFNPVAANRLKLKHNQGYENIYEPHIKPIDQENSPGEIPLNEQVEIVKLTFDSCGWREFSPVVVFTGHASHSANNPYASSLDCGACAGNPGKRNARTLARMANSAQVRKALDGEHGIKIPKETLFIAAEHITSTDEVSLFDEGVSGKHQTIIEQLKKDLQEVKHSMTRERLNEQKNSASLAEVKANSWSETRPEWGLAQHAGYIIGPRSLSKNQNFSDCFFSSYDWTIDDDGSILEGLMQGPLVVCQWINNHYYFSTVDNDTFGGGSKISHNVTGKFGVMQGNASDLKMGLPLQSLMKTDDEVFHNPLRLSTLIQTPKSHIAKILKNNPDLKTIIDNAWIHLFVMDPEEDNTIERYHSKVSWRKTV